MRLEKHMVVGHNCSQAQLSYEVVMVFSMNTRWAWIVALAAALVDGPILQAQDGNPAKRFEEVFLPLKGKPEDTSKLTLIGDAPELVKLEPKGLRITLPKGFDGKRPNIGVHSRQVVQGDFEITAAFEVL